MRSAATGDKKTAYTLSVVNGKVYAAFTIKVPDGSCVSAIDAEQLTFIYGDVANRRHVRLGIK